MRRRLGVLAVLCGGNLSCLLMVQGNQTVVADKGILRWTDLDIFTFSLPNTFTLTASIARVWKGQGAAPIQSNIINVIFGVVRELFFSLKPR